MGSDLFLLEPFLVRSDHAFDAVGDDVAGGLFVECVVVGVGQLDDLPSHGGGSSAPLLNLLG